MERSPHTDGIGIGLAPASRDATAQATSRVFMVRPACFGANPETGASNAFQSKATVATSEIRERARHEFDGLVSALKQAQVDVFVVEDTPEPQKPDAVFPNNWVSFHPDGVAVLYPMMAPSRRSEARADILDELAQRGARETYTLVDLRVYADADVFLEGTGSLAFDRPAGIAYACRSARTSTRLLSILCGELDLRAVVFSATGADGQPIYHTNVMMSVGSRVAVVCLEAIEEQSERKTLERELARSGHEVIAISRAQMGEFAGNMIELSSRGGEAVFVMSSRARAALLPEQAATLERHGRIVSSDLTTIETHGGGSARCMITELF